MQAKSLLDPLVIGCSEAEPDGQGIERAPLIPALIRRSEAEPDQRDALPPRYEVGRSNLFAKHHARGVPFGVPGVPAVCSHKISVHDPI